MTIIAKACAGISWLRFAPALLLAVFASRSLAQDIYYFRQDFRRSVPRIWVTGVDQCPDGAGPSADKFCEADLPMLKAFVRQERISVCGGALATGAV